MAMYKALVQLIALATITLVTGCTDRYQISQDEKGRTIRLDQRTGEIAILENDQIVVLKNEQQRAAEDAAARAAGVALSQTKFWPSQDFKTIGVEMGTLLTSWRDERLHYQLELRPVPKGYAQSYSPNPLTLKMFDSAGFVVVEVELARSALMAVVGDDGQRYALSANASVPCSRGNYESLAGWSLSWRL